MKAQAHWIVGYSSFDGRWLCAACVLPGNSHHDEYFETGPCPHFGKECCGSIEWKLACDFHKFHRTLQIVEPYGYAKKMSAKTKASIRKTRMLNRCKKKNPMFLDFEIEHELKRKPDWYFDEALIAERPDIEKELWDKYLSDWDSTRAFEPERPKAPRPELLARYIPDETWHCVKNNDDKQLRMFR